MGVVAIGDVEASALADRFKTALADRGPDGWASHHDAELLLVHRRLAIIDLSTAGSQPLWNEDGTICVVANGEIYNHAEIRRRLTTRGHRFRSGSDSEVLVHLYEDGGIDRCCDSIDGMFAFALWDARTREVFLVRDRLGIKPLVIAEHAGGVSFASTLPALLSDPQVPHEVREDAFLAMLKWGFVPTPWSAVRAARRVEPGTWMQIRHGRVVREHRWWSDAPSSVRSTVSDTRSTIERAVHSHLMSDVPVGALLSAGIDSGIVAALAARGTGASTIEAWTVRHEGFADNEFPEAAQAAAHFGISCHPIDVGGAGLTEATFLSVVTAMDEPLAASSLVGLHALFRALAPFRRVVLTGDGGDELFGGYDWHHGMPAVPAWAADPIFGWAAPALARLSTMPGRLGVLGQVATHVRRHPASIYLDKLRATPDSVLRLLGIDSSVDDPMEQRAVEAWERFGVAGQLEQMLAVDRATALVDEMLAKLDTASMAYGVEARVPLLSDMVVAAAKQVLPDQKRDAAGGKLVLRQWYGELGPSHLSWRRKTGFNSPVNEWFQAPAGDFLTDAALTGMGLFGPSQTVSSLPVRTQYALATIAAWRERWG